MSKVAYAPRIRAKGIGIIALVTGDCNSAGGATALLVRSLAGGSGISPPDNHDPDYHAVRHQAEVIWPSDVTCPGCPVDDGVGPFMSPNILKLVGDFTLPVASSVASFAGLADASPKGQFLFLPKTKSGDIAPFANAIANAALGAVVPAVISVQPVDGFLSATMDLLIMACYVTLTGPKDGATAVGGC